MNNRILIGAAIATTGAAGLVLTLKSLKKSPDPKADKNTETQDQATIDADEARRQIMREMGRKGGLAKAAKRKAKEAAESAEESVE